MKTRVNYPGYWAHGKIFDAEQETLVFPMKGDGRSEPYWAERPSVGNQMTVQCFIITDPELGKFGIPLAKCEVLERAAA